MRKRVTRSIVPNLLTLANLFSGFTAIIYISNSEFTKAALFILMAAIFDLLDGLVARLLKATSEIGAELDSLCDAVSFGIAPAYLLYMSYFHTWGDTGIFLSALPALAGVTRLARFNVESVTSTEKYLFTGLPIPSAALFIISYVIFIHLPGRIPDEYSSYTILAVTGIVSYTMVSRISYDALPKPTLRTIKQKPIFFSFIGLGVIGTIITKGEAIFPFMLVYILFYAAKHYIIWFKEIISPEDVIDENSEHGKSTFEI